MDDAVKVSELVQWVRWRTGGQAMALLMKGMFREVVAGSGVPGGLRYRIVSGEYE